MATFYQKLPHFDFSRCIILLKTDSLSYDQVFMTMQFGVGDLAKYGHHLFFNTIHHSALIGFVEYSTSLSVTWGGRKVLHQCPLVSPFRLSLLPVISTFACLTLRLALAVPFNHIPSKLLSRFRQSIRFPCESLFYIRLVFTYSSIKKERYN